MVEQYLGDGGYQIIKMGVISYTHWVIQRRGANIGEPAGDEKVQPDATHLTLSAPAHLCPSLHPAKSHNAQ